MCENIGGAIARMHDTNTIHGDLTTSNLILRSNEKSLVRTYNRNKIQSKQVLIDFGLSFMSTMIEDKAVDLYVLERAFISTHPNSEIIVSCTEGGSLSENYQFENILENYRTISKNGETVLKKLVEGGLKV